MIKIRLQRKGRIRRPIYHIVVADSRSPRDGRIIEQVGRYDGVTEKKETVLNEDRIMYWLNTGAQPTDSVRKILRQEGLLYKRHLMMWGKSEAEIESALAEWKAHKDSKKKEEITHRDQVKAALAAEEKEYKSQASKNAAAAVEEAVEETPAEEPAAVEEAVEETPPEEPAAVEEVAEETPAEEPTAVEEAVEETPAEEPAAVEEVVEEAPAEEPAAVEEAVEEAPAAVEEEAEEAPAEEPAAVEEAPAEEPAATEVAKTSTDMGAKEAAEYIAATNLADLEGFVTDAEERKTVLAAWEAKKAE